MNMVSLISSLSPSFGLQAASIFHALLISRAQVNFHISKSALLLKMLAGIPIHRSGHIPEAACPVCVAEKDDHTPRKFFAIRGFDESQHDPHIPPYWFNTPPIKPTPDNGPMDALRVCDTNQSSMQAL